MALKAPKSAEFEIKPIQTGRATVTITGNSPLILNSMSQKSKQGLLAPGRRKTTAEKNETEKHDPPREFRDSAYRASVRHGPTLLGFPAAGVKGAMRTAALRVPGINKTEFGQMAWVHGEYVHLWGVPLLHMAVVRSADMNRTPDIRTRAILPRWLLTVEIEYVMPALNGTSIGNLLHAAGLICGIGDFRQEKGAGSFGQFRMIEQDDPLVAEIKAEGGREAQENALAEPVPYDHESGELLSWYQDEMRRRGLRAA